MDIRRINTYTDPCFSQKVLYQHGCFLVDEEPCEIEIISDFEAVIWGKNQEAYPAVIEEFLFFTPHITVFYNEKHEIVKQYPKAELLTLSLEELQPSQFYVDEEKVAAVSTFIDKGEDIIVQVSKHRDRYISLDGHTRLYYAVLQGFATVRAVIAETDEYIMDFVEEAVKRGIHTPKDLILLPHEEYEEKWNKYCDEYFSNKQ